MKHDEKEKFYNEQKERITLYLKYNIKNFKSVEFTSIESDPMGGYAINGYINNNKDLSFTASTYADQNNQFEADYSSTSGFQEMMPENPKSVSEIQKEQKEHKKIVFYNVIDKYQLKVKSEPILERYK